MTGGRDHPNIVVVVLDCVRASDATSDGTKAASLPTIRRLERESVVFPKAIAPAPWTIPSHASLFTGQSPWVTGCHWRGDLKLAPSIPRLPTLLRERGYRTMSLSANPLISPAFGLTDGFDLAAWGGWWEPYLRFGTTSPPNRLESVDRVHRPAANRLRKGALSRMVTESRALFVRHPFTLDTGSRFVQRFRGESGPTSPAIARWIEPTLQSWAASTPESAPLFAFVNLLDAHEPYFYRSVNGSRPAASWWTYARLREDWLSWATGRWTPTPTDLHLLHELYVQAIAGLDQRLSGIISVLRDLGRWDDTLLVVTSDHGQEFGEHGMLFHMFRVDEQLIRIPLWVRYPRDEAGGARAQGWASLVDLFPTLLTAAGYAAAPTSSGFPLEDAVDHERAQPVVAVSDGIVWKHFRDKFDSTRAEEWDRVWGSGYLGNRKVIVDAATGAVRAFDVSHDPAESQDLWPAESDSLTAVASAAREAGAKTMASGPASLDRDVEERLKAWGYL